MYAKHNEIILSTQQLYLRYCTYLKFWWYFQVNISKNFPNPFLLFISDDKHPQLNSTYSFQSVPVMSLFNTCQPDCLLSYLLSRSLSLIGALYILTKFKVHLPQNGLSQRDTQGVMGYKLSPEVFLSMNCFRSSLTLSFTPLGLLLSFHI